MSSIIKLLLINPVKIITRTVWVHLQKKRLMHFQVQ